MSEYNGWTNYETWQCALWIDNDPYLYAAAEDATADGIRELITDYLYEQSSTAGLLSEGLIQQSTTHTPLPPNSSHDSLLTISAGVDEMAIFRLHFSTISSQ